MAKHNPYAGKPDAEFWEQGFEEGFRQPKNLFAKPPEMLTAEAQKVWKEGLKEGRTEGKAAESEHHRPSAEHHAANGHDAGAEHHEHKPPKAVYELPSGEPVFKRTFDTGEVTVEVEVFVKGSLTIEFEGGPKFLSMSAEDLRAEAMVAINAFSEAGVEVDGLPAHPKLHLKVSGEYLETAVRTEGSKLICSGAAKLHYRHGEMSVEGSPEIEIEVTTTPHDRPHPSSLEELEEYMSEHAQALAGAGMAVATIGLACKVAGVLLAPETAGASLVLVAVP